MRPYWYLLIGVVLVLAAFVAVLIFGDRFTFLRGMQRSLVGATGVLVVYVDNPGVLPPDTTAPVVTLIGTSPVQLTVGQTYVEQGATSTDNVDSNLPIELFVDGSASSTSVTNTFIDTSAPGTHTVLYQATDNAGNTGSVTRTVIVSAASTSGGGGGGGGGTSGGGGGGGGSGGGGVTPPPSVVPPTGSVCSKKGDFNNDTKVNIADFSILAYWYKRPLTPVAIRQCIDLNNDGKITLADFSILAYYWNK